MAERKNCVLNLTLTEEAHLAAREAGSSSTYVSSVLEQRSRAWREALGYLQHHGWSSREIIEACKSLWPHADGKVPERTAFDTAILEAGLDPAHLDFLATREEVRARVLLLAQEWATRNECLRKRLAA